MHRVYYLCISGEGKEAEALDLHYRMLAPNKAVTAQFGVPGLKHMMDKLGYYGGPLRQPLSPLDEKLVPSLTNAFTANGFWHPQRRVLID